MFEGLRVKGLKVKDFLVKFFIYTYPYRKRHIDTHINISYL
jgi:hypothetical protein